MATVYPFPMALYHSFMLWRKFILSLWIFIIHSCYCDSFSFPYGSLSSIHVGNSFTYAGLSSFHVMTTVSAFPMALYHPFMLWRQFILLLCSLSSIHVKVTVYPFPMALYSSIHVMARVHLTLCLFIIL
jgi:hypothetical protein